MTVGDTILNAFLLETLMIEGIAKSIGKTNLQDMGELGLSALLGAYLGRTIEDKFMIGICFTTILQVSKVLFKRYGKSRANPQIIRDHRRPTRARSYGNEDIPLKTLR